jgi:hypothetical protein
MVGTVSFSSPTQSDSVIGRIADFVNVEDHDADDGKSLTSLALRLSLADFTNTGALTMGSQEHCHVRQPVNIP